MNKEWKLSESGLQLYEGKKHIATVHYAGNPIVDVSEALENAKLMESAPNLRAQVEAQAETIKKLRQALKDAKEALEDAQGEWLPVSLGYAPEFTQPLKEAVIDIETALEESK